MQPTAGTKDGAAARIRRGDSQCASFNTPFIDAVTGLGHAFDIATPAPDELRPYGRRTFLAVVAGGLTSLVWGPPVWRTARDALLPVAPVLPPPLSTLIRSGWRIYSVTSIPKVDLASWRLRVDGLVERPLELRYGDLATLPRTRQVNDFHCVTGWSVDDVHWGGVRLTDLLTIVRPTPQARAIGFYSFDGAYSDSLTLPQARHRDVLLADHMDGEPLTRGHGAPLRLVIPRMYGYKGVKWIERITLVDRPFEGYWEQRGYDRNAWIGHSNGY
ncbi:MAG TPA: molybdopterin-dependent oxidoreductase [Gaiellaceae bacterium]